MVRFSPSATYAGITVALLVLLALTTWTAYMNLGPLNLPLALVFAAAKALLVFLFFMHLLGGSASFRIAALLGFFMLAIAFALTLSDYMTRNRYVQRVLPVSESEVPLSSGPQPLSRQPPEQRPPPPSGEAPSQCSRRSAIAP